MGYKLTIDPDAKPGPNKVVVDLRGGNKRAFLSTKPQFVVSGPADTGKTFACCVKLHKTCVENPGSQHGMLRKTFASMAGSVIQTFNRVVAEAIKMGGITVLGSGTPTRYTYANGATVWVGGLDNPDRVLSSERDTIYVAQAEELALRDWEMLATRCTGRAAVVKHPQLYGDCNPSGSKHWIRERAAAGVLDLITTRHQDNPTLYKPDGTLTEGGERRIAALRNLTGVRRKRLFDGIWATAEGAVYDTFAPQVHVKARRAEEMKRFFIAIDDGYTNPAAILLVGEDGDGRWHCFREFYQTNQPREVVVGTARGWHAEFGAELVVYDAAVPELGMQLKSAGLPVRLDADGSPVGGKGKVLDGIRKVQDRLQVCGDGLPRYTLDPSCVNHQNEFESYVWKPEKDVPEKQFDHTMDALRYLEDLLGVPTGAWSAEDVRSSGTAWTDSRDGELSAADYAERLELE